MPTALPWRSRRPRFRALAPLKAAAESNGGSNVSPLWSGQAAGLGQETTTAELTSKLAEEALELFKKIGSNG